jgi:diguanylate cyclase (GGDEF)-like protein
MNGALVATLATGALVVALILLARWRWDGDLPGAGVTAASYLLWTLGCAGLVLGLPAPVFWLGLRPAVFAGFAVATAAAPGVEGVERGPREWAFLLLDGCMTVGGFFGMFWILARTQTLIPERAGPTWGLLWLPVQMLLCVTVAGLIARVAPTHRMPSAVALAVGLIVLAGDTLALVTGRPTVGIGFWLGGGLILAVMFCLRGASLFVHPYHLEERPRPFQLWQLPIPYVVVYIATDYRPDAVIAALNCLLALVVFAELVVHSRRNESLWSSLRERNRVYQGVLQDSQDVILQIDAEGMIEFANPAAARVLSIEPDALVGTVLREHLHPDDTWLVNRAAEAFDWSVQASMRVEARFGAPVPFGEPGRSGSTVEWRSIEWTVSPRAAGPGRPGGRAERGGGWVLAGRDISARIALERELVLAARTDGLTGLLNRPAFLSAVDARLAENGGAAVLFVDLDGFKGVNDTLGHAAGDRLLCAAAECLRQAVGRYDTVARLGGDEFAVLPRSFDLPEAREMADAVVTAFNGFDETAHGRRSVSASVGVVILEGGPPDRGATELLRDADLAMYRAKQRGGAGAVEFEPWMSERVLERSRLRADLETAVANEALTLHLQPVIDLHTRRWTGFEALIRWPVGGETWSPAQFLPVAEESGLIVPMGAWVLRESLRQLAGWRDDTIGMAVNVSAQQLVGTEFFDITMQALEAGGISPDRLTLEITEQAAIQDLGRTASRLESLRSEGVHVAIDDFGTGFSSLQYLSRLPVDILKIDRKFVWGLGQHAEDDVLVRSMIGLAAELGLEVIAEGVETRRQAELLLEYGCRLAQGFLFSPPRPIEELRSADPFVSPALRLGAGVPRQAVGTVGPRVTHG